MPLSKASLYGDPLCHAGRSEGFVDACVATGDDVDVAAVASDQSLQDRRGKFVAGPMAKGLVHEFTNSFNSLKDGHFFSSLSKSMCLAT